MLYCNVEQVPLEQTGSLILIETWNWTGLSHLAPSFTLLLLTVQYTVVTVQGYNQPDDAGNGH